MSHQKDIKQFIEHAENVGEDRAKSISMEIAPLVEDLDDFIDSVVYDREMIEFIRDIEGVGKGAVGGIRDLAISLETGDVEVRRDNFDKVRVVKV